jgi:mono/diheme cytochrome c family protein
MSPNHRLGNSVEILGKSLERAFTISAAFALMSFMGATPAHAQGSSGAQLWVAPERASRRTNPVPPTADAVKRGHNLFRRDCEQCHGKAGHGDGPLAASLVPHPADLASKRVQSQSDGALFWKMTEGRGVMPKATLNENEKWAVIAYLRTMAARP